MGLLENTLKMGQWMRKKLDLWCNTAVVYVLTSKIFFCIRHFPISHRDFYYQTCQFNPTQAEAVNMESEITEREKSTVFLHQLYLHCACKKKKYIFSEKNVYPLCYNCKMMITIFMGHRKLRLASPWPHIREILSSWPLQDVEHAWAMCLFAMPIKVPGIVNT